ncbi:hypothetical protein ILUMI_08739 [Ignelater luminosus]|uniref:Anaphase-promoting complex subunit 4 n=1 Tax=Ignelater luminosus TaxID=2038154 RepID=A0A8K0D3U1_IGNLU|nr:hypothetical protein ILUMI_08739 [Ignelater luminosus]
MYYAIKQLEERNVATEIDILLWSNKIDLVAFSNIKGEVSLHRLSWARAWNLAPPKEGVSVKGLAWRPDGKVLAVAYSSGEVLLINVENKSTIHKIEVAENISCIFWVSQSAENQSTNQTLINDEDEQADYIKHLDLSSKYLPDLPPLSNLGPSVTNTQEENSNSNLFQEQKELNLLVIGTYDGYLHISIFGQFPCVILNLNNYLGYTCSVISVFLSNDLSLMYVTVKDDSNDIKIVLINTSLLKTHSKELFAMALKHGYLNNLITYLSNVIVPMKETWETILLEMDAKLSKYASRVPEGTLSSEFLDLLMFGITSDEMQEFLLQDLTEKGLKKFGQVMETCYANIEKLLLKLVTKAAQNITYHLAELRGMARLEHRYKVLGLSEDIITKAISANGAFLVKGGEMHQVITQFMISFKAFFRWLYTAIIHLMDIQMLPEMTKKNTQQDVNCIVEFVRNFDKIDKKNEDGKGQFTMERLGQYLNDHKLTMLSDSNDNLWENFLTKNECIQNDPDIIKHYKSFSLIQQFKHLAASIEEIFVIPKGLISEQVSIKNIINCLNFNVEHLRITKINFDNESTLIALLNKSFPADGIYFLEIINGNEIKLKCCYLYFKHAENSENYFILDAQFYSNNALSVLLQESNVSRTGVLYQFSTVSVRDELVVLDKDLDIYKQNIPKINAFDLGSAMQKYIDGMVCSQFAVSGCRRVSIVLSENRKKIRLFEMEAEEDDEEDADMTNSARESDTSMQEENNTIE